MKGHWLAALGVLLLLSLTFLLGREGRTPGVRTEQAAAGGDFGYVAQGTQLVQTNEDGIPLYVLDADRIEQDAGGGDVMARHLTLRYAADDARRWTLTAREARLKAGESLLHLKGAVRVTGLPEGSSMPARIETARLDYDTKSQDVRTQDDVRIDWGRQRLDARGLSANLKQGQLTLESKVHGRFLP